MIPSDGGEVIWNRIRKPSGAYLGENAFGVKKVVNRVDWKDTRLILNNLEWLIHYCHHSHLPDEESCSFKLNKQQAIDLSQNVRVIAVGQLVAPFVSNRGGDDAPTIDNPTEIRQSFKNLHIRVNQLWIVNGRTGEIVKKYSRETFAAEYPVNVEVKLSKDRVFSDTRCSQDAGLFPFSLISLNYSVDGSKERLHYLGDLGEGTLRLTARQFVDLEIPYCFVSSVEVLLNDQPFDLKCEVQERYIGNESKCNRIQLTH